MDIELPPEVTETIAGIESNLDSIETLLLPLLSSSQEELLAKLGPLEAAKLHLASAYTLNALFYSTNNLRPCSHPLVYLRTQGLDPSKHPVAAEMVIRIHLTVINLIGKGQGI